MGAEIVDFESPVAGAGLHDLLESQETIIDPVSIPDINEELHHGAAQLTGVQRASDGVGLSPNTEEATEPLRNLSELPMTIGESSFQGADRFVSEQHSEEETGIGYRQNGGLLREVVFPGWALPETAGFHINFGASRMPAAGHQASGIVASMDLTVADRTQGRNLPDSDEDSNEPQERCWQNMSGRKMESPSLSILHNTNLLRTRKQEFDEQLKLSSVPPASEEGGDHHRWPEEADGAPLLKKLKAHQLMETRIVPHPVNFSESSGKTEWDPCKQQPEAGYPTLKKC